MFALSQRWRWIGLVAVLGFNVGCGGGDCDNPNPAYDPADPASEPCLDESISSAAPAGGGVVSNDEGVAGGGTTGEEAEGGTSAEEGDENSGIPTGEGGGTGTGDTGGGTNPPGGGGGDDPSGGGSGGDDPSGGGSGGDDPTGGGGAIDISEASCLNILPLGVRSGEPTLGTVAVGFSLVTCDGWPVTGLQAADLTLSENGAPISAFESASTLISGKDLPTEGFVTLVLDNSPSVANSGALEPAVTAAKAFVETLLADKNSYVEIRVAFFSKSFQVIQDFTRDESALIAAIDSLLSDTTGSNTTNLYGALLDAISGSEERQQQRDQENQGGMLTVGQIVVFTDGSDQAGLHSLSNVSNAVQNTNDGVTLISFGGEVSEEVLQTLGKSGGYSATNLDELDTVFGQVAAQLEDREQSNYVLMYCTPKLGGTHELAIEITPLSVALSATFNAQGFDGDSSSCSFESIASACDEVVCGGLWCGGCFNGGSCAEGGCICAEGFGGENCKCEGNWIGLNCDVCPPNWTGTNCDTCATNFTGPTCKTCEEDWIGELCDQCSLGFVGPNCSECASNWSGDNCEIPPLSAGYRHTCGLKPDGSVVCWGWDKNGQSSPPAGAFQAVSAGWWHTCGLKIDGSVVCWGQDSYGQSSPPAGAFKAVSAGSQHTCGLKPDGSVVCWGLIVSGENNPPGGAFKAVSAGSSHTCGLKLDGSVVCWGLNSSGQSSPPGGAFKAVSAAGGHTCGLRDDGSVVCWGQDFYGQSSPPGGVFKAVSAGAGAGGEGHTCGLKPDGSVVCWGKDGVGKLSPPDGAFKAISAGVYHTCGLKLDGSVVCWGFDDYGQSSPPAGLNLGFE